MMQSRSARQGVSRIVAALSNSDLAAHPRIKMSRLQASEVERTHPSKLPNELAGLPRFEAHLVRVLVLHLGKLLHELRVFAQFLCGTEHHLVLEPPRVLDREAN